MLATTVAPLATSSGTTWSSHAAMPGPCRPTAFSMPCAVGWSRGAGLPSHANAASDLVTTAPTDARSKAPASSTPYPAVPEAVITGDDNVTAPMRVVRSIDMSCPPVDRRRTNLTSSGPVRGIPAGAAP